MSPPAQTSTVEAQPLIAVRNVRASSRWYAKLLGADTLPDHAHREMYDRIWRSGRLLLQLHAWDAEQHPNLVNADAAPPGHGVVLWFQLDDFDWLSSARAGWGRRSSKNLTSTPRPGTGKFGSATPMATSWLSPVRTAKAARRADCNLVESRDVDAVAARVAALQRAFVRTPFSGRPVERGYNWPVERPLGRGSLRIRSR
jgi:hypothetical protein